MAKTRIIRVFSFILALTLVFASFSAPSYAASPQQFNAFVASALAALNIVGTSISMGIADSARFVNDFISAPFKVVANQFVDVPYTTPMESIDEYLERSVLKIDKDKVTIDGVEYTDIWLSTDAAEKFRVNAWDIENAWDIASQSEGTFASGAGYIGGTIPVYNINGALRSQNINSQGIYGIYAVYYDINGWHFKNSINDFHNYVDRAMPGYFAVNNQRDLFYFIPSQYTLPINRVSTYVASPFDFDWVSGTLPPDEPLEDEGLRIRVPTSDLDEWYTDYPDTGPNVTFDMGDPTLENKIDDLINLIIPLIPILDIDFVDYENPAPQPEPIPEPDPYPDPDPQPGTVIPDLDWTDLFNTIKNIFNKISEQVSITTAIKNLLDKIKWFFDDYFINLGDTFNSLPDIFERHVIQTIRSGLTGLKNIFLPILALLRNALGIWHYVVEWFQAILGPLTFYLTTIGQGYPAITIPIYASIAGIIVIAVYRRFGR